MTKLFNVYRVLALVVGVLLVVGTLGSLLKYLLEDGSTLQQLGDDLTPIWLVHGWIYIVYVVVAFLLSQKARWSIPQLLLMLVAGLIPGLIFWVEHRVAVRLREDHPELARS
ncbi:DUF3817 domain-containing protein [Pimelobacter simplex]|uniref:DUF3817 domain-containing protein n=1 Tax=Nocardioides simplex TaxID=2045 RepID=A0A0A1DEG9_NOCSI|nr:DUF3817 domain-containing protein [Pimelobacter simplex]AIY15596.1 putative membrane protein [Pimelobacter simplex]KAB2813119.1 DUF3817 domain-containing protein [Pimelobacter simplex]MCG8150657.1 DUF3817 domain-containing protein [Pimelobacter simplex]SFM85411.1 integral membrane protein [Pimelobacter simplex]GEB15179.1 hypothetical protein NSI01_34940 [Pimelobacter simplex]